jgi:hypothetical protein
MQGTAMQGSLGIQGQLGLRVIRYRHPRTYFARVRSSLPVGALPREVRRWRVRNLRRVSLGLLKLAVALVVARWTQIPVVYGTLYLRKRTGAGEWVDLGLASVRVVTTAGVNFIVAGFLNTAEPETMHFHGFGTGGTAEAIGDTALVTELTTQYAPDNTRPTGTTITGATSNIYRSVATLSPDTGGTIAITEHGIFSATTAGTLLDRSLFAAVNLVAGSDSLQATYDLTFTAGS